MSLESALASGRDAAERDMTDTFVLRRRTGNTTQDETTGREVDEFADEFTTVGKLQQRGASTQETEAGARMVAVTTLEWHTPVGAEVARTDDVAELITAGPATDPQLIGTRVRIVAPMVKSHATARRYRVEAL